LRVCEIGRGDDDRKESEKKALQGNS
jgi:hypothetical protein